MSEASTRVRTGDGADSAMLGTVAELFRYPVKSFGGERLERVPLAAGGLYGDRCRALIDPGKQGFARYYTARQLPQLLAYTARLVSDREIATRASTSPLPNVEIMSPSGETYGWDERLLDELSGFARRPMTMIEHAPGSEDSFMDDGSVLIVTGASLRELERSWGKPLDRRRFRANLVIELQDDTPFAEAEWIGRKLIVGGAELSVDSACERCRMIGLDPDTLERDDSLQETVRRDRASCFGVYASVVRPGIVRLGDGVSVGMPQPQRAREA